jgi:hypothetical protein
MFKSKRKIMSEEEYLSDTETIVEESEDTIIGKKRKFQNRLKDENKKVKMMSGSAKGDYLEEMTLDIFN